MREHTAVKTVHRHSGGQGRSWRPLQAGGAAAGQRGLDRRRKRRHGVRRLNCDRDGGFKAGKRNDAAAMMRRVGPRFCGISVSVAFIVVEMQDQHAAMGLAQHMKDGSVIGASEGHRRGKHAKRVSRDHEGRAPAPKVFAQPVPHGQRLRPITSARQ